MLLDVIQEGGFTLINLQEIEVQPALLVNKKRGKRVVCSRCRKAYPSNGEGFCLACQGQSPYVKVNLRC